MHSFHTNESTVRRKHYGNARFKEQESGTVHGTELLGRVCTVFFYLTHATSRFTRRTKTEIITRLTTNVTVFEPAIISETKPRVHSNR